LFFALFTLRERFRTFLARFHFISSTLLPRPYLKLIEMITRRILLRTSGVLIAAQLLPAQAQISNVNDAINKAGRQRMLSQQISKSYLALLSNTQSNAAQSVLDKSMALIDRQTIELKVYAPNPELRDVYTNLDAQWGEMKTILVGRSPSKNGALQLLTMDEKMLALAEQGVARWQALTSAASARLVNVAGRQRMLSQRLAKLSLATALKINAGENLPAMQQVRKEFSAGLSELRNAPESKGKISAELDLVDAQWVFFDHAAQRIASNAATPAHLSDVFLTSERLLSIMELVTQLYAGTKT
jgi:nitrate/nitrite-specific signal transduction histidine kinase